MLPSPRLISGQSHKLSTYTGPSTPSHTSSGQFKTAVLNFMHSLKAIQHKLAACAALKRENAGTLMTLMARRLGSKGRLRTSYNPSSPQALAHLRPQFRQGHVGRQENRKMRRGCNKYDIKLPLYRMPLSHSWGVSLARHTLA